MNLPAIQGKLNQSGFFIYAAADAGYFDRFGRGLANSVLRNSPHGVHFHLYDPRPDQLEYCQNTQRISVTWEYIMPGQFDTALAFWSRTDLPEPYHSRKNKMLGLKQFTDNANLPAWIYKTYYACMRFVRLSEIVVEPRRFLEIDIDGLVRGNFATQFSDDHQRDFYLYQKEKGGHLAGAILYTDKPQCLDFINKMSADLRQEIQKDNIYWFLDQHCLDRVIVNYRKGLLPISYVDWRMQAESAIWSAKGKRKDLEIFKKELQRYCD